jgi:hypothetical protein
MCNLYSITTNQAAIIALFRVVNRYAGIGIAHDRRRIVWKHARQRREVASNPNAMQTANRNVVLVVIAVLPSTARSGRRPAAAGEEEIS